MSHFQNLLKRFALVENAPLYAILLVAGGMAIYTPFVHLKYDPELTIVPSQRDLTTFCKDQNREYHHKFYEWLIGKTKA